MVLGIRIDQIEDDYKDYFFNLIKSDALDRKEEYENTIDFEKVGSKVSYIFKCFLESENYMEYKSILNENDNDSTDSKKE